MMRLNVVLFALVCAFFGCKNEVTVLEEAEDLKLGGETSITGTFIKIFEQPAPNLSSTELDFHRDADKAFGDIFVTAPNFINGGLGPVFNQNSCESCHLSNGRSPFPIDANDLRGLLIRISVPGAEPTGEPLGIPNFGGQLQTKALFGKKAEAKLEWTHYSATLQYADGDQITLTKPNFSLVNPYLPLPDHYLMSPRIAPPVIGLGLIEAISESDILTLADPDDSDADGISGKANWVWDHHTNGRSLGRFGWKAGQPSLLQQTAGAYNQDMGITNPRFPIENCFGQSQMDSIMDDPEIDENTLKAATFYTQSLAIPQRRNTTDPQVRKGKKLFYDLNCTACHQPNFVTGTHSEYSFLSNQKIFPYSDLLLHDMGDGLADNRSEFDANGNEWRTPPLWGLGLTKIVGGPNANYLHDGRAKTLEEAIMWHGGESETSKENFRKLSKTDRLALVKFLESL